LNSILAPITKEEMQEKIECNSAILKTKMEEENFFASGGCEATC
jgi:hypothetical protein